MRIDWLVELRTKLPSSRPWRLGLGLAAVAVAAAPALAAAIAGLATGEVLALDMDRISGRRGAGIWEIANAVFDGGLLFGVRLAERPGLYWLTVGLWALWAAAFIGLGFRMPGLDRRADRLADEYMARRDAQTGRDG